MRKHLLSFLASLCLLPATFAAPPPQVSANLLDNPGFESGLDGWLTDGSALLTGGFAHTGGFSAGGLQDNYVQRQFQPIPVSLVHELSFWATRAGGPVDNVVFYYSDNSSSRGLANGLGHGNGWLRFDLTGQLLPGKELTGFRVIGTTPGPAHFDDFTLTMLMAAPVPEPGTVVLLMAGLAGLGLFGLRRMRSRERD
jgi:hypothetical protein